MSLWDTIMQDAAGGKGGASSSPSSGGTDASSASTKAGPSAAKQIVIVGSHYAGKRTLAARLRESSGVVDKSSRGGGTSGDTEGNTNTTASSYEDSSSPSRASTGGALGGASRVGGGLDHSFVDVRSEDGAVLATVELFVLDHPGLVPVVFSSLQAAKNSLVLFVADLSSPNTALEEVEKWSDLINKHVSKIGEQVKVGTVEEMRKSRIDQWNSHSTLFVPHRQRAYAASKKIRTEETTSDDAAGMPSNNVVLDSDKICLVPSIVVGAKLDSYQKYCRGKQDPTHAEIKSLDYGLEVLRKQAMDMKGGFLSCNSLSSAASAIQTMRGLWFWVLTECLDVKNGVAIPEPPLSAASGGDQRSSIFDGTINNSSLAGTMAGNGSMAGAPLGGGKDGNPSGVVSISEFLEGVITYNVEEQQASVFIPQGADLYELLSGFVRTQDGVAAWPNFFPPAAIDRPKISSHTTTLNKLKELLSDEKAEKGDDLWEDF